MLNYENIAKALNYLQRMNYCLKVYYLKNHPSPTREKCRISNYNLDRTISLFKPEMLQETFKEEELKVVENLKNYSIFINQKCFIECQYDTNPSIYNKKVEYINAKVEHIIEDVMKLCYVIEGLAIENKQM